MAKRVLIAPATPSTRSDREWQWQYRLPRWQYRLPRCIFQLILTFSGYREYRIARGVCHAWNAHVTNTLPTDLHITNIQQQQQCAVHGTEEKQKWHLRKCFLGISDVTDETTQEKIKTMLGLVSSIGHMEYRFWGSLRSPFQSLKHLSHAIAKLPPCSSLTLHWATTASEQIHHPFTKNCCEASSRFEPATHHCCSHHAVLHLPLLLDALPADMSSLTCVSSHQGCAGDLMLITVEGKHSSLTSLRFGPGIELAWPATCFFPKLRHLDLSITAICVGDGSEGLHRYGVLSTACPALETVMLTFDTDLVRIDQPSVLRIPALIMAGMLWKTRVKQYTVRIARSTACYLSTSATQKRYSEIATWMESIVGRPVYIVCWFMDTHIAHDRACDQGSVCGFQPSAYDANFPLVYHGRRVEGSE